MADDRSGEAVPEGGGGPYIPGDEVAAEVAGDPSQACVPDRCAPSPRRQSMGSVIVAIVAILLGAAIRGLGTTWARQRKPAEIAAILESCETESPRRLVAVEALVLQASPSEKGKTTEEAKHARTLLDRIATSGPPLARLAAQIGRTFVGARLEDMHAFFERMYGG